MENVNGVEASKEELAKWKKGQCKLWLGNYIAHVELVTRETVSL